MRIKFNKSLVKGKTRAPSSKSYTIRSLMCAALAPGLSQILRPLDSDDTEAALRVLRQIGIKILIFPGKWEVTGGNFKAPTQDLFCGDSAATLRFMSGICAGVPGRSRLTAGQSLSRRPVDTLISALKKWGIDIASNGATAPVTVNGGVFPGGLTELPGDISSQYVTALLLTAPFAQKGAKIRLTTPLESRSYVLMTLECLKHFGIVIDCDDSLRDFSILPQIYQRANYKVEGDWSSVSYLLGLGAAAGQSRVSDLNMDSLQGDRAIVDLLRKMGASIDFSDGFLTVTQNKLKAVNADLNDCIDLLPTMAVLAGLAEGTSIFTGIKRARLKESDRIAAVREGLERAGINVVEEPDSLAITGKKPVAAVIDSKDDHRIAMAFSLMGAAAGNITIEGAECVSKTYPAYWETIQKLGVQIDEQ